MSFSLYRKVVSSFAQQTGFSDEGDGGDYVFEIDQSIDSTTLATSLSDNSILFYDTTTLALRSKIQAHQNTINAIEFSKSSPYLIYSAASDNHVCLWDLRTPALSACINLKLSGEVTGMSVSMSDSLLAAGCESAILFYDIRGGSVVQNKKHKKIAEYADVHSDMITQLKFNPNAPNLLTSASEDGLICVMDTATTEAEDAVVSILNTECPTRRFGFFGESSENIFALSTVETASFWHFSSAQRLAHFPAIRENLEVEYLVDCIYEPSTDKLCVLAGDYNGNGVLAEIDPEGCREIGRLTGGHVSTIRCCSVLRNNTSSSGGVVNSALPSVSGLFTGGEDSRVCSWRPATTAPFSNNNSSEYNQQHSLSSVPTDGSAGNSGSSSLKEKKKKSKSGSKSDDIRHKPY